MFFGFPLYFTELAQARALAHKVMGDLGEPYAIAESWSWSGLPGLLSVQPSLCRGLVRIHYLLARASASRLAFYDGTGKLVRTILSGTQGPGRFSCLWVGCDNQGQLVPAGLYFFQLSVGDQGPGAAFSAPAGHETLEILVLR
ncbi:MAG: FlgD immunoglobulin-like domain containing protein [candidate division WOR-3 bacterium]